MITPKRIDKKAYRNFKPSRKAAIDPVQAPVKGRETATNSIKPIFSYFSMTFPRRLVCSKTQLTTLLLHSQRLAALASFSKKSNNGGTGNMLPIMDRHNASYHGIWNEYIATGKAPRSSTIGKADIITVTNSREIFQLRNCSIMVVISFAL